MADTPAAAFTSATVGSKRKAVEALATDDDDLMTIEPLGAGQEVGRSCHILKYKGKTLMLDCGIHPGHSGFLSLPFTDSIDAAEVDMILITHFHLDHCGALPWFMEKTTFSGRVFMTHATKAIYTWLLSDYVKVSNVATEHMLYDEQDIQNTMDKIESIDFHQEVTVDGVHFCAYKAGHVLGAAMFMIEIAGVKILYTGDYSREEDRHLDAAEIPPTVPDVLITESTYGVHQHPSQTERENRFTGDALFVALTKARQGTVHEIVQRGGKCLIPVFALGRAQELLLILEEYWSNHRELWEIPIYYASALAKKCMAVFQTYVGMMNKRIQEQMKISNPFHFQHISNLRVRGNAVDEFGPSVILASPGMMQSGLSRELFEAWAPDPKNGVIIAGYCVEGTLAKEVMQEPEQVDAMTGGKIPRRLAVSYISFSAHVDYAQNAGFIKALNPPHVVLVHGEANEMHRFATALSREYEESGEHQIQIYTPENTQQVQLRFRGEKMAKVIGGVAAEEPVEGTAVSGLLIKRGFNYHLVGPEDLPEYTELTTSIVTQKTAVKFPHNFSLLHHFLTQMYGGDFVVTSSVDGKPALQVMRKISIVHDQDAQSVTLEWDASPESDMWADSVMAVILKLETSPAAIRVSSTKCPHASGHNVSSSEFQSRVQATLEEQFGNCTVEENTLKVNVDSVDATVNCETLVVVCENGRLKQAIQATLKRLHLTLKPFSEPSEAEQSGVEEVTQKDSEAMAL